MKLRKAPISQLSQLKLHSQCNTYYGFFSDKSAVLNKEWYLFESGVRVFSVIKVVDWPGISP